MEVPFSNMGSNGPPQLYLRGDILPYIDYIMGGGWRSELRNDHYTPENHMFHDGAVILRPSSMADDSPSAGSEIRARLGAAEEQAQCLRLRRCGAFCVRSEVDVILGETTAQASPAQLFGWSASGGVWVLRMYPRVMKEHENTLSTRTDQGRLAAATEVADRFFLAENLAKQQEDMSGLCRVLEDAGGEFYGDLRDCPEVVKLGLVES